MTATVPGATNVQSADLTADMIVPLATTGPQAAQTTVGDLAAYIGEAELSNIVSTSITTAGAGTLTAAAMKGGLIVRSGPVADYSDTTATAAALITALGADAVVGTSWLLYVKNLTAFTETILAGVGVTLSGNKDVIPANSFGLYLLTYTGAGAVSMQGIFVVGLSLPSSKVTTGTAATAAAGDLTGAYFVNYINNASNATYTTRTAAQMFADIPNARAGMSYQLAIRNLNATGLTLTAADGTVTLSGTMTIAQNVTRMFNVTVVSATAVTITSMGISAAAA